MILKLSLFVHISDMREKYLPLDAKAELLTGMVRDLKFYKTAGAKRVPIKQEFKFISRLEGSSIRREARLAAFKKLSEENTMVKQAFDTRRIDQENDRNPRANLQYWHRTDPFISDLDVEKVKAFGKVANVVKEIKADFQGSPEWHESYVRQLDDHLNRIIKTEKVDDNIFSPQVSFLEQLVYARYRLTIEDMKSFGDEKIREALLSKDELLVKRGKFTGAKSLKSEGNVLKDGQNNTQQALMTALFGGDNFRKDGESIVERTITITIRDNVVE